MSRRSVHLQKSSHYNFVEVSDGLLGTLSNDDGNARENVIEIVVFGSFILLRDYSESFNLSNVAELSGN